ncbi:Antioxidant, AhpC/TSA family [Aphelenchoides bicaudatus]|nr:Antioxidant, AhpC/TSA family [Aphelenchoides bicaudatus]
MADLFKGAELKRKDGSTTPAAQLKGKVVALYFSAHWCPPCRLFTPELAKFYAELNKDNNEFEIVFVSFDQSDDQAISYIKEAHGNWLYLLPNANESIVSELTSRYGVDGIPVLIVVREDGTVITKEGRSDVSSQPARVVLSQWKQKL